MKPERTVANLQIHKEIHCKELAYTTAGAECPSPLEPHIVHPATPPRTRLTALLRAVTS